MTQVFIRAVPLKLHIQGTENARTLNLASVGVCDHQMPRSSSQGHRDFIHKREVWKVATDNGHWGEMKKSDVIYDAHSVGQIFYSAPAKWLVIRVFIVQFIRVWVQTWP